MSIQDIAHVKHKHEFRKLLLSHRSDLGHDSNLISSVRRADVRKAVDNSILTGYTDLVADLGFRLLIDYSPVH